MDDRASLLARHKAFWSRADVDRPLLTIQPPSPLPPLQIPAPPGVELPPEGYLSPEMLDPERYFRLLCDRWDSVGPIDGDQFRTMTAYWYVPWLEAICGCPVWYVRDSGTMYSMLPPGGSDMARGLRLDRNNPWFRKLREFYVILRELNDGRYPLGVSMPMRGPIDMLGALVGVEAMCLGFAENAALTREVLSILTDIWIAVVAEQLNLLPPFEGNASSGVACCEQYGLWVPGTNAVTQCDLAVAVSPRTYERFLVPCDERICASMEYPIIHLHSAAMHVLEPVLSVTRFAAIQVVIDPGPADPRMADLIPYFQRVQAAGKPLIVHASNTPPADLALLLAELSPRGLCIRTSLAEPEAAR
jgi:hypothetical protein